MFRKGYTVVFKEYNLKFLADFRIFSYFFRNSPNHFDNLFSKIVTGSSLCSKDISFRSERSIGVSKQISIISKYIHNIEMLSLVFVETLYLNIEYSFSVKNDAGM